MSYALALIAALIASNSSAPPAGATPPTRAAPHAPATPQASATPQAPAAAATPATPLARAQLVFEQLRTNSLDRKLLTDRFATELTPDVASTFARDLAVLGKPLGFSEVGQHRVGATATYDFSVSFAAGAMTMTLGIDDASDRISRLVVRRALGATRSR